MRRLMTVVVACALLLLSLLSLEVTPAEAHAQATGSDPKSGARLSHPPSAVSVTFDGPLMDVGAALVVRSSSGLVISDVAPRISRNTISVDVDSSAPDDVYTVAFRVVSQDGHTISTTYTYTVGNPPSSRPEPSKSPAGESALQVPTPVPTTSAASREAAPRGGQSGGAPQLAWLAIAAVLILGALASIVVMRRR